MKAFWNVDVNDFGIFQQQFDNIFVSIEASPYKWSTSIISCCIQINSFIMVQEQFDNIFVSILASPYKCSPSIIPSCIQLNSSRMFQACEDGETKIVQLLLEHLNSDESGLNIKDKYGLTPFMWACYFGHKDVVKLLLDHPERIELNARDNGGWTAFIWACQKGHKMLSNCS